MSQHETSEPETAAVPAPPGGQTTPEWLKQWDTQRQTGNNGAAAGDPTTKPGDNGAA